MTATTAPLMSNQRLVPQDLLDMEDPAGVELVDGRLEEKPVSADSSRIGLRIGWLLMNEAQRTGTAEVYGADLGYQCFRSIGDSNLVRKPDVSVILVEKLKSVLGDPGYMPIPADLAVEVVSPNEYTSSLNDKVEQYLAAGFGMVWVVDPGIRTVYVHKPDGTVAKLRDTAEITGEPALPAFRCLVADLLGSSSTAPVKA